MYTCTHLRYDNNKNQHFYDMHGHEIYNELLNYMYQEKKRKKSITM